MYGHFSGVIIFILSMNIFSPPPFFQGMLTMSDSDSDSDFDPDNYIDDTSESEITEDEDDNTYSDEEETEDHDRSMDTPEPSENDRAIAISGDDRWMTIEDDNDVGPPSINFTGAEGPVRPPNVSSEPIEYFKLFFSDTFLNMMVEETNRYAAQWIAQNESYLREKKRSIVHLWIKQGKTNKEEVLAFLAFIMNMGLIKKITTKLIGTPTIEVNPHLGLLSILVVTDLSSC